MLLLLQFRDQLSHDNRLGEVDVGDHEAYFIKKHHPFPLEVDFDADDTAL